MLSFAFYCLKVAISSAIFYGYYCCFLRKGRFYSWNRFYLLGSVVLSLLVPFFKLPVSLPANLSAVFDNGLIFYAQLEAAQIAGAASSCFVSREQITLFAYILAATILLLFVLQSISKLLQLRQKAHSVTVNGQKIFVTDNQKAPFVLFNAVFWKSDVSIDSVSGQHMLRHELAHVHGRHYLDILFMELVCIVLWVNPVFWFVKRELKLVHEFIADKASIADGDASKLSMLILQSLYPSSYMAFSHQFYQSPIKRRLAMLSKNTILQFTVLRKLMVIPLAAVLLYACGANADKEQAAANNELAVVKTQTYASESTQISTDASGGTQISDEDVDYHVVEVKPKFQGGDANAFSAWVNTQVKYPKEALEKDISGKVILQFAIKTDGSVGNIKVLRGADPLLDKEAARVVALSPKWTPGEKNGRKVNVLYTFPVVFELKY